jgi:2-iminobutanoate/2-iminopropanoate deaminase
MTIEKQVVATDQAPKALGPYSQAIRVGGMVFCSGQVPIDPTTGELVGWEIGGQVRQVFKNIKAVLAATNLSLNDVVKTTVFLAHMSDFAEMNEIYAQEFGQNRPARSTVEVARLPKDALVEIEVIAIAR